MKLSHSIGTAMTIAALSTGCAPQQPAEVPQQAQYKHNQSERDKLHRDALESCQYGWEKRVTEINGFTNIGMSQEYLMEDELCAISVNFKKAISKQVSLPDSLLQEVDQSIVYGKLLPIEKAKPWIDGIQKSPDFICSFDPSYNVLCPYRSAIDKEIRDIQNDDVIAAFICYARKKSDEKYDCSKDDVDGDDPNRYKKRDRLITILTELDQAITTRSTISDDRLNELKELAK